MDQPLQWACQPSSDRLESLFVKWPHLYPANRVTQFGRTTLGRRWAATPLHMKPQVGPQ